MKDTKQIILFGSIARGSESPTSDIDLFILLSNDRAGKKLDKYLDKLSGLCLSLYGNRLAPYSLTEEEFKMKKNLSILDKIKTGIRIYP